MKILIYALSVVVFASFLYTALVATIYLVQFVSDFSGEGAGSKTVVLVLYGLTLEALAIVYKKLPYKPQTKLCNWLEKVSLFG